MARYLVYSESWEETEEGSSLEAAKALAVKWFLQDESNKIYIIDMSHAKKVHFKCTGVTAVIPE